MLIDEIKEYSQEVLVEELISTKELERRDILKGQLLAHEDFKVICATYEDKPLDKLKEYLERFDVYSDTGNLNLFINVTEPRQELVLLSKIDTLKKIKAKLLEYVDRTIEFSPIPAVHSEETAEDKGGKKIPAKGKLRKK